MENIAHNGLRELYAVTWDGWDGTDGRIIPLRLLQLLEQSAVLKTPFICLRSVSLQATPGSSPLRVAGLRPLLSTGRSCVSSGGHDDHDNDDK